MYAYQERYLEAESVLQSCEEGQRRVLGEDHPDTRNAANLLRMVRELKEAT
jgi:hypothetical protein